MKSEKKRYNKNKTLKKKGGFAITAITGIFAACMSTLQFIYYITAISKNTQPTGPNVLTISSSEIEKIKRAYSPDDPPLVNEQDMSLLKKENPKGMNSALDKKYIKKVRRKNKDGETIEGYTLSAKGKDLINTQVEKLVQ